MVVEVRGEGTAGTQVPPRGGGGGGVPRVCRVTRSRIFVFSLIALVGGLFRGAYILAEWIQGFKGRNFSDDLSWEERTRFVL